TIKNEDLVPPGMEGNNTWLLVMTDNDILNCSRPGCNGLLGHLTLLAKPDLQEKVVVIVGGSHFDALQRFLGGQKTLSQLRWYSDPNWAAANAISLSGVPIIFGLNADRIVWALPGVLIDNPENRSILLDWISK
ncbi:MAG: hypothetical protein ACHQYP_08700, partial [Nitrospiria bacterium]